MCVCVFVCMCVCSTVLLYRISKILKNRRKTFTKSVGLSSLLKMGPPQQNIKKVTQANNFNKEAR